MGSPDYAPLRCGESDRGPDDNIQVYITIQLTSDMTGPGSDAVP